MAFKLLTQDEIDALSPEELAKYNDDLEASKKEPKKDDEDLVTKLVNEKINSQLIPIKEKLDNAFAARDEALRKLAEFELKEKEANLKKLEEEGKHKEAYELRLAEVNAKAAALEKANVELTRDVTVRDALKGYAYRNDNAADLAFREVVAQLVQNEQGTWVHRSGVSIKDFVTSFATSEEFSFLFKLKANSGNGGKDTDSLKSDSGKPKSLFQMTQAEVIELARQKKLPKK